MLVISRSACQTLMVDESRRGCVPHAAASQVDSVRYFGVIAVNLKDLIERSYLLKDVATNGHVAAG